ncbi:hypothetical protein HZA98_01840 [Candidatus Woesearchaeota archaeon]|nr:hypothetical protein [Candidatus Woesearchaeota archaeon]
MVFTTEAKPVELITEGGEEVLKLNYESVPYTPSIEDNALVMMDAVDKLVENPSASRILFVQRRNYAYDFSQTKMLREVANLYSYFVKSKRATSLQNLGLATDSPELLGQRLSTIQYLMLSMLKQDPLGAYAELKRVIRRETIAKKTTDNMQQKNSSDMYIKLLEEIFTQLDKTSIIQHAREYLAGYTGDRDIYKLLFRPTITPDFMYTKIAASPPLAGEQLAIYKINDQTEVNLYKTMDDIKTLYHITPPEFKISEDKYELIDIAKKVLTEHEPRADEFLDPGKMRNTFTNIGKDLLRELAEQRGMLLTPEDIDMMVEILVRHTIGFGVVELLLQDEKIQDITINAPMGQVPIFLLHEDYNECTTNITPTTADFESWATKFRLLSGRPLDEANPILDTEIIIPGARSRLSVIGKPLNPYGYGMSFRRHRDTPWTLPLFIKNGMISPLAAGLLSFTIDGSRSHLVAGTRSSGKCLKGEELVQLADGKLVPIKEVVEEYLERSEKKKCDDGFYAFVKSLKVMTTEDNLKISPKEVTCVWKRTAPKYLYEINLRSGKKITTTAEHPVLAMDRSFFGYKRSDQIEKGMRIGTARKIPPVESKRDKLNVNLADYSIRTNGKKINFPQEITKGLLEFLGYVLGDGHIFNGGVQFINNNPVLQQRFGLLLEQEFNLKGKIKTDRRNKTTYTKVFSRNLARYLNKVFGIPIGNKAGIIYLPDCILSLEKAYISILIRAIYDCDGYVAKDHRELEYSTKSPKLAQHVQLVLARFGIISFVKKKVVKAETYHSIFINGASCNIFHKEINFTHPEKQRKLGFLVNKEYLKTTNIDSIPYGNTVLRELRKKLRVSPSELRDTTGKDYWAYENNRYHVTTHWFKKLIFFYEEKYNTLKNKKHNIKQLRKFSSLLESRREYIQAIKALCKTLGISQEELAGSLDQPIRNTFYEGEPKFLEALFYFQNIIPIFQEKVERFLNPDERTVEQFIFDTNLKYVQIAKALGLRESTIKYYRARSLKETNPQLERYFVDFKDIALKEIHKNIWSLYQEVVKTTQLLKEVNVQQCLEEIKTLRTELHIENEDYEDSSISNFFNKTYSRTNLKTLGQITKKTLECYDSATDKEVEELLALGKRFCSEDIFWDEVVELKKISSEQEWVYDLTVEPTHNFIANGVVVHNTSFLGALLLEIMRRYRVLTIEDTLELPGEAMRALGYNIQQLKVRSALVKGGAEVPADEGIRTSLRLGDSALIVGEIRSSIRGAEEVFIVDKGKAERVLIKELEGRDISEMYVPTMDRDLKFKLKKVIGFVKHPKRIRLLEVTTKTGRKVTVTPDHSLFTQKCFTIFPIECKDLTVGSKIIIPEKIPCGYSDIQKLNLMDILGDECRLEGYEGDLKQIIQKIGWKKASKIANTSNDIYCYLRKGIEHQNIPITSFKQLAIEANHNYNMSTLQIKKGTSKTLEVEIEVSKDFCRFLGYYASEGYTQKESSTVVFSNGNPTIISDIIYLSRNLFNVNPYVRETKSLGIATQIILNNKILGLLLSKLGCGRIATEKRVPSFIFGLSEEKICEFLKGYFDGDGCQVVSESTGNTISVSTVSKCLADDITHLLLCLGIVARIERGTMSNIGKHESYIIIFKQRKYVDIFLEKVGFKKYTKRTLKKGAPHSKFNTVDYNLRNLEEHVKLKREYRHLRKFNYCGKDFLKKAVHDADWASERIKSFVNGDFYIDEVKEIKEINLSQGEYVYDLSVQPCQNFIGGFGGIMLHNTEASALYEAMRIGASANVVAGTIHGDSPYGVFDRVVNDLQVPRTSFKATDLIIMCNPIRTADGLKKVRRVTSITEVRKEWEDDPLAEKGFVDLMKYNAKTDALEPTPELMNGESDVLKSIGANVKEWVGNWDAIWDNIVLRGDLKKMLVDYAEKTKMPQLLEAEFSLLGNDMHHRIAESIQEETGALDTKRIKTEWEEWLKKEIRRKQLG